MRNQSHLWVLGIVAAASCNSDPPRPDRSTALADAQRLNSSAPVAAGQQPCAPGARRECVITLGEHEGILSCFHGFQDCTEEGVYGACHDGTLVETPKAIPRRKSSSATPLAANSSSTGCDDNPCDPFCLQYVETPPEPLIAESLGPGFSWETGALSSLALSSSLMTSVPCMSGSDCQGNQRCTDVATSSDSAHSKCESGSALVAGADDCAAEVCTTNPECCQRGWDCAHDVCEAGTKLSASCDDDNPAGSCVATVCAADSTCCTDSWDGNCVSLATSLCGAECDACGPGETSSADGTSCYFRNTISANWDNARDACQAHGDGWDLANITSNTENDLVHSLVSGSDAWVGYSCSVRFGSCNSTSSWDSVSGSSSFSNWSSGEPNESSRNACARMLSSGSSTKWFDKPCSDNYHSICEGPPSASTSEPEWSQACVDLVAPRCDATCSTESPASELGLCVAWQPGETDPNVPGQADLALGIPCGSGTVPVCNHGGVEAPAGVTVEYFDASSAQYPSCSPDSGLTKGSCAATTVAIAPGECVNVQCPSSGANALSDGDTLVVNPSGAVAEYSCLDNWTVYSDGVLCASPTCADTSSEATFKPVRMLILLDNSFSMLTDGRWQGALGALTNFFESADSAGIGVAIDMFPLEAGFSSGDGCAGGTSTRHSFGDSACDPTPCSNPMVPLGTLTADPAPLDVQEMLLLASFPGNPTAFSTPSLPALTGGLQWAATEQAANPDETFVVVFVTDGEPSTCLVPGSDRFGNSPVTNAALATLAGSAFTDNGIRTYTLGLDGSDIGVLDNIAAAGGTDEAFVITSSNSAGVAAEFTAALVDISRQGVSCTFPVSGPEESDLNQAEVVYSSDSGSSTLPRVNEISDCGEGWYYDDNDDPQQATLCPSTCETVKADNSAKVTMEIPCASNLEQAVFTDRYQASCADNQEPLWQFLRYSTTVPEDGSVEFRVRTASSELELATAEYQLASTATQAAPNCTPGSGDGCPVDLISLFESSGIGNRSDEFLELELVVNPGSNFQSPTVESWQITYSCAFDE